MKQAGSVKPAQAGWYWCSYAEFPSPLVLRWFNGSAWELGHGCQSFFGSRDGDYWLEQPHELEQEVA